MADYDSYKEKQHYQPPPQFGYDGYQNNHHGYQQGVPQPGGPVHIVEPPPMAQQQRVGNNPVVRRVEGNNHMEIFLFVLSFGLCLLGSPCALCCTIPGYLYAKMARQSQDDQESEKYSKKAKKCMIAAGVYAIVAYVSLLLFSVVFGIIAVVVRIFMPTN